MVTVSGGVSGFSPGVAREGLWDGIEDTAGEL